MSVNLVLINDRVLVLPDPPEEVTEGGILIPDQAKETPQKGTVLAVGPGKPLDNGDFRRMQVGVDDKIVHDQFAGRKITIDKVEYLIMDEQDIIGVFPCR